MIKPKFETKDFNAVNLVKLAELFPGVVADGKVNVDLLRSYIGEEVFGDEAYEFTWVGKREAVREAGRPIRKTLRPCKEESKDWDTTENLYIEGDNLEVLKLLQESYLGKVKMIYIDPPYNTGNDFVYRDNFTQTRDDYDEEAGVYNDEGGRLFRNTESNGRFHSDWCNMIYPRLVLARNLLRDDGVVFISIDDNEVAQLIKICDEVFGESNFVGNMIWQSRTSISNDHEISTNHNHTLVYCNKRNMLQFGGDMLSPDDYINLDNDPRGPWKLVPIDANHAGGATYYPIVNPKTGKEYYPPNGRIWAYNETGYKQLFCEGRIKFGVNDDSAPKRKLYLNERLLRGDKKTPSSLLLDAGTTKDGTFEMMTLFSNKKVFDYPKPSKLIHKFLHYGTIDDSIVLDFFSGSATAAHAVMQLNAEDGGKRKFIMVQLPEVCAEDSEAAKAGYKTICDIGKERIRRAGEKIKDEAGLTAQNLDIGFRVLKLDDTNMKDVYYAAGDYTQNLLTGLESNIKDDRTDMDLLFGCLLEWGLPLSMPYTSEVFSVQHSEFSKSESAENRTLKTENSASSIQYSEFSESESAEDRTLKSENSIPPENYTIHTYNDGDLIACFADTVSEAVVKEIARRKPLRAVFRDSSFVSSPAKINVEEIFKLLAPNTNVKVI